MALSYRLVPVRLSDLTLAARSRSNASDPKDLGRAALVRRSKSGRGGAMAGDEVAEEKEGRDWGVHTCA